MNQTVKLLVTIITVVMLVSHNTQIYATENTSVLIAGLYEAGDQQYHFGNVELFNLYIQPQALLQLKTLETAERVNEVRKTGECYSSGICQKELTMNIPLTVLDNSRKLLVLSPQGDALPITPVKIETRALLVVADNNKLQASLSGGALITAVFKTGKITGTGFVFILPKNSGQMQIKSFSNKAELGSLVQATDKWLSINNQQIPNKMHIKNERISKAYEVSFANLPDKYLALQWSAESPCEDNFSIYNLLGKLAELEWLGRGCDV